jgi:Flp pilus assembly protein TadD
LALRSAGRTVEALNACRKAARLDPRHAGIWMELGALHLQLGRPEAALRACRKAVRLAPRNAGAWEGLGRVQFRLNHIPDAIIAYQNAAAHDPQNSVFHTALAACYRLSGQSSLAEEQIEIARATAKGQGEYPQAVLEAACGNAQRAVELLGSALQKRQAGRDRLAFEPGLGSLRDDPGFAALLHAE